MINQDQITPEVTEKILAAIKPGMKITKFDISEAMAMTNKVEGTVFDVVAPFQLRPHYAAATHGKLRLGTYKLPRKRSGYYLDLNSDTLLFAGWDVPVKTDMDVSRCFTGNACLNLWAPTIEELKDWIENKNLNPFFTAFDEVIYVKPPKGDFISQNEETLVYPERPTSHGQIQNMRDRLASA